MALTEPVITSYICRCCNQRDFYKVPYPLCSMDHIVWAQCNNCGNYTYIPVEKVFRTPEELQKYLKETLDFIDLL